MPQQFDLDFEGGLIDRFPDWMDCVRDSVYGSPKVFKAIAADLDMSSQELSKRLSDHADIHFLLNRLPELLVATGNLNPIFWLVEKFCDDPDTKDRRNRALLAQLLPEVIRLAGGVAK